MVTVNYGKNKICIWCVDIIHKRGTSHVALLPATFLRVRSHAYFIRDLSLVDYVLEKYTDLTNMCTDTEIAMYVARSMYCCET